jgi:hypothetical protein
MSVSPFEEYYTIMTMILDECSKDKELKKILFKVMKEQELDQNILQTYQGLLN